MARAVVASDSRHRSASTLRISGWSIRVLPKTLRWAACQVAFTTPTRIPAALPITQSRRTGLQRHEKIRRCVEDDGSVGARFGDAGKYGGFRRWETAAIAVVCNSGSERQGSAFQRAAGHHHDALIRHYGPLEHGECSNIY